jgi:polyhydroxyalkanoate synthesis regulator phasin
MPGDNRRRLFMQDLIEKTMNLGLGLFVYSREKIEEMVDELVNRGDVAKKDARRFTIELVKKGEEQRDELKKLIRDEVSGVLNTMNIAQKKDIVAGDELARIVREQVLQVLKEQEAQKGEKSKE